MVARAQLHKGWNDSWETVEFAQGAGYESLLFLQIGPLWPKKPNGHGTHDSQSCWERKFTPAHECTLLCATSWSWSHHYRGLASFIPGAGVSGHARDLFTRANCRLEDGDRSGSFTRWINFSPVVSLWAYFPSFSTAGGRPAPCSISHQARRWGYDLRRSKPICHPTSFGNRRDSRNYWSVQTGSGKRSCG